MQSAVDALERAGDPSLYFERLSRGPPGMRPLADLPRVQRLALEMAAHEEGERRALEGELALLEQAWRDAEEIAAIADALRLPPAVEQYMQQHLRYVRQHGSA